MNKSNNNPFFSIIVPAYNVQQYLEKSLNSILSQTFKDYEIVLVNDCSTDNTEQLCNQYRNNHNQIKYIKNKENIGLAATRNVAMQNSTGDWFVFLDSDDFFSDNYFLNKLSKKCKNCDCVFYGFSWYFESKKQSIPQNNSNVEVIDEYANFSDKLHYLINTSNMHNNIFRVTCNRQYLKSKKLYFNSNLRQAEDFDMLFSILWNIPNIKALNSNQYQYRQDNMSSLTKKNHQQELEYMYKALVDAFNRASSTEHYDDDHKAVLTFLAHTYYSFLIDCSSTYNKEGFKSIANKLNKYKFISQFGTSKTSKIFKILLKIFSAKNATKFYNKLKKSYH